MPSFITINTRPKCIVKYSIRVPEELDAYLKETSTFQEGRAERAKQLMERGAMVEIAEKLNLYNLIPLQKFFAQVQCPTMCVSVLPVSDPQARFLKNGGVCE